MAREFYSKNLSKSEIIKIIRSLEDEWEPVIFRDGLSIMNREEWWNFLKDEVKLEPDRRQFSAYEDFLLTNWWEISNQKEHEFSYAFSKTEQPLHCDNAWFSDPAEINFFVMEKQAISGGQQKIYLLENIISDLKHKNPNLLDRLSSTPVLIKKGDEKYENFGPIIRQDKGRNSIYWNYYRTQKEDVFIKQMCEEFFEFLSEMERMGRTNLQKLYTGDCMCFNDSKILHGRKSFKANKDKERILFQSMWKI